MLKLMKYEFRKTMFSKMILLVITGVLEALFLAGVFLDWENGLAWGIIGLTLCAIIGICYIGLESLTVFHRDLNTKQSYMLFLTPHDSYQILGAKVVENGVSLLLAGCFFVLLAAADFTIATVYLGGFQEFLDTIERILSAINVEIQITAAESLLCVLEILSLWLMTVVTGILAITLCATVLAGKRFSGFFSILLFLLISWACSWSCSRLNRLIPASWGSTLSYLLYILAALVLTAVMYLISGWIMEQKLSV